VFSSAQSHRYFYVADDAQFSQPGFCRFCSSLWRAEWTNFVFFVMTVAVIAVGLALIVAISVPSTVLILTR
jgi:hypothetical protein